MSTGTPGTPGTPRPGAATGVIKIVTLGSDQYVIAKLDTPVPDGDFDVDVEVTVNPAAPSGAPTTAGCFARVKNACCKSLHIIG
jgi:hypothetical protein